MMSDDGYMGSTGCSAPSGLIVSASHMACVGGATGNAPYDFVEKQVAVDIAPTVAMMEPALFDLCAYILKVSENVTLTRLQILVYYCYAWSLLWDEKELFVSEILAGPNGPVIKQLYDYYKGTDYILKSSIGLPDNLSADTRETVDAVIRGYGSFDISQLVGRVQKEDPWARARRRGSSMRDYPRITREDIEEYYRSLI